MPAPSVQTTVIDLTNRVNATGTYNAAVVIAAKKGPINKPTLVTSQTDLLERFTPNEKIELGWDTAYFEAYQYLATQSNLYVVRAANTQEGTDCAKYGGCHIRTFKSEKEHTPLAQGFTQSTPFDFENDALVIYGANEGAYNNDISVAIITDPDVVKLDGCFIVRVYKKGILVETHTCSLDPSMKNGYGVNCFAETTLLTSNYVRADVNDEEDNITQEVYDLQLTGKVIFDNEIIKHTAEVLRDHIYKEGDVVVCNDLTGQTAFYICTEAGRTADVKPAFTQDGEYLKEVKDAGQVLQGVTWELAELVKDYAENTEYKKGEIITRTKGSVKMNFRAFENGTTGLQQPAWTDAETGEPLKEVIDGTQKWVNLKQEENVSDLVLSNNGIYFTNLKGQKGQAFALKGKQVYTDQFMGKVAQFQEEISIVNETKVEKPYETWPVVYTAVYKCENQGNYYMLPKASKVVNGTYETVALNGGSDGSGVTTGQRIAALKTLKNAQDYNFQIIFDGGYCDPVYHNAIDEICESREQSCHGIIGVPYEYSMGMVTGDAQFDMVNYRQERLKSTPNLELYAPHQLVYDEFNDRNIYVSPTGFVAAKVLDTAQTLGWHWATAGMNRGVIPSIDTARTYEKSEENTFADVQINTIIKEPGVGQMIDDDYTLVAKACDMQDAHISRYVNIYLRPKLKAALKPFLFEFNDEPTRNLIVKMLDTFMAPEVSSRAITAYRVVCDETNNKPRDIQNSICNCWLYICCNKVIRWMKQSIIMSPAGVDFDTLEF